VFEVLIVSFVWLVTLSILIGIWSHTGRVQRVLVGWGWV